MSQTKNSTLKAYLFLVPLALIYILALVVFSNHEIVADEGRYIEYATNLTHGFYTDTENPSLRNGPGYPLLISPLVLFDAPYFVIKIFNPIMILLGLVLFFKTLRFFLSKKKAIIITYILGLYPVLIKWMLYMHSESLAIFLICGFLYFLTKSYHQKSKTTVFIAASFLGYLALTKVIFGYVILATLFFCLIAFIVKRSSKLKDSLLLLIVSFAFCIPYLIYTYNVTNKVFYWGSQSGEILYWRSTPFPQEHGDWISSDVVYGKNNVDYFDTSSIIKNHGAFIKGIDSLKFIEKDDKYKEKAIENIKNHPIKYFQNTISSGLRLFFNYPYSYTPQKVTSYFYILPNMFLVVFLILAILVLFRFKIKIPINIVLVALISIIFIGGLTLSDGRVRHLLPIVPILLFFISYAFKNLQEQKLKLEQNKN